MAKHHFGLHDTVRIIAPTIYQRLHDNGVFEVIRLLPQDVLGNFSYRLKSSIGERIALEHELTLTA